IRLLEDLELPAGLRARCNPRSSTGRIDLFTRTVVDRHDRFDDVPEGYAGPLWLEVVPRSFDVRARTGQRLNQVRVLAGRALVPDERLARRVVEDDLLPGAPAPVVHDASLLLGLSLQPDAPGRPIGWRARRSAPVLDLGLDGGHEPGDFFEPVAAEPDGTLRLQPEEFYLLASVARLRIPPDLAAEMLPYDVGMGELRTNYAGFFDPGFGWGEGSPHGARAVLEVRPHDVPFRVEHGQPIFRLQFSDTVEPADRLYGERGSAYQNQGLALARYFRAAGARA
ncbi:MAG TPA: 2'-deoxycytidine 5'-triphosphate deaminase, partial [Planctomycetota bacterium]|nr:2'-deoxycytidine 5'-triphosphate deaminase [Planctomycetota bacterium]